MSAAQVPSPLTLEVCLQTALEYNPATQAAREAAVAAQEAVGEARAPYFPDLDLSAGYSRWQRHAFLPTGLARPGAPTHIGPTDDWMAGLKARYTLFDSGERRAQSRAAIARRRAAEDDATRVRQELAYQVYQTYYGLVEALEVRSVAQRNLARSEEHLALARERREAGAVPQADVIQAQVEVANARLARVQAEDLVRVARGRLNTAMGQPVEQPVEVVIPLQEVAPPDSAELSRALEQAVQVRPELRAAHQRLAVAHSTVDAAKSAFGLRARAEGGYGWRDTQVLPRDEDWAAGMSIEFPVFTGFLRTHRLARAKAEASRAEAEVQQLALELRQEVWAAHSKLEQAYEAIQAGDILVQDAQEGGRLAQERYQAGAGTMNDLLDAQNALARAEAGRVEAQWDYHLARAAFNRASGELERNAGLQGP